ncbi:MAG: tetratricopeptide repeat protein [Nitrosomonadales bacterium]|nr:tetratricopeptide repeat protein [Nitrosomonadales bacterium]
MQKYSRTWIPVLLLVLATTALYGQFLWNPIIFDDVPFFRLDNENKQQVSGYRFSLLELRSLPYATLAWSKEWFGLEVFYFRVENLLLHAGVVLALFFFLAGLFAAVCGAATSVPFEPNHSKPIRPSTGSGRAYFNKILDGSISPRVTAFFAALLFALHPVATYAAGYLVQRTIIMATLFGLLAMLSYVHGSVRQKPPWLWMSVPFYYLAVFSKEHAIMLPFALLALTVLLHEDWRAKLKKRWGIFTALAGIAAFVLLAKKGLLGSVYEINASYFIWGIDSELTYPLSVLTQSWLFFKYAALWISPNPAWMSIDMREPFARSLFSPYLLALICFVVWGAGAFWLLLKRGRAGLAGFALLFPWVMFLTELSTVRIQEVFVLYRSYLWAAGAFCLLPVIFAKCNVRMTAGILVVIALAMFPISMERLMTFSHPVLLWDDAEKLVKGHTDLPGAHRIYFNRGTELVKIEKYDSAIADFKQAIALADGYADIYGNMGAAYLRKGDLQNALMSFNTAIDLLHHMDSPPNPHFIYGRALVFEKMGEMQKAQTDFKVTCRLAKRGCEKLGGRDLQNALVSFNTAIDLLHQTGEPPNTLFIYGRALVLEKMGETQKAQADYKMSCRLAKKGCEKLSAGN